MKFVNQCSKNNGENIAMIIFVGLRQKRRLLKLLIRKYQEKKNMLLKIKMFVIKISKLHTNL